MKTQKSFQIEEIKQNLIQSCIEFNAFHFLPYLLSPTVTVDYPNKIRFYGFLKSILNNAGNDSQGTLELRIEREHWDPENVLSYNFYDKGHTYSRINLKVKEENNCLFIDLVPF